MSVLIIAEAGVNHNGSIESAMALVDAAAMARADIVKFQTFRADRLVTRTARKADYQIASTGEVESQYEMLRKLELPYEVHHALLARCKARGVEFLSTAFDIASLDFLVGVGMERTKVPSGELTNLPLLRRIGGYGKPVILSTGMATLSEVEAAVNVLELAGTSRNLITLLHCTTEYPAPISEVNLRALETLRDAIGVPVGFSDHTEGIEVSLAAVALGATVIEKHFTLDRRLPGPDHRASIEPQVLSDLVRGIRNIELAMGSGIKAPTASELRNLAVARQSVVAACPIRKGEQFTEGNLTTKRPGTGISPMRWDELLGQYAIRDFDQDEPVEL